jgi:hypothetical protein
MIKTRYLRRLIVMGAGIVLLMSLGASMGAARPLATPCTPGASYLASCDVDHDGDVDIFDIQLAAGHWSQTGAWASDNGHDHLGQTWTGTTSLRLTGSYGPPYNAPLVLGNSYGNGSGLLVESAMANGIAVQDAGWSGIRVNAAGTYGVFVGSTNLGGVYVHSAGTDGVYVNSAGADGAHVNWVGGNGLYVGSAGSNGVYVGAAGAHGVYAVTTNSAYNGVYGINSGGGNGLRGDSNGAITSGVYGENSGGGFGVAGRVLNGGRALYGEAGTGWAGWFNGNVTITGSCSGCLLAGFGINRGARDLQPGDVVSVQGVEPAAFDNAATLWLVAPAQAGQAAVGVVAGRAGLRVADEHLPSETGRQLVSRDGAAAPGDYVTVVYSGPMQVRLSAGSNAAAGARVTPAGDGRVRPLESRVVDGMVVAEGAPVLGLILGDAGDGRAWVLINPQ